MTLPSSELHSRWGTSASLLLLLALLLLRPSRLLALNSDGSFLLSFKYAVLNDPLSVLADWNYDDATPCAWNGVMCMGIPVSNSTCNGTTTTSRVISLVLPNAQLLGSIPPDLALIEHLRHVDLSGNFLNGTLPSSLFNVSELRILSLSNNEISGEIPELVGDMRSLQVLNLSDNALTGTVPNNLTLLPNLTVLSLGNNYLYGDLPGRGFERLQVLDLSSNLVNGSLPPDFGGASLRFLNLSYNRLTGKIPPDFGSRIPPNATLDLSNNNLTGAIPESQLFLSQKPRSFAGNPDLCGTPLKNLCPIPSTLSNPPPNETTTAAPGSTSPPAFAAIPRNPDGSSPGTAAGGEPQNQEAGRLRPAVIAAITIGDLGGIALLFIVFLYVYQTKKKQKQQQQQQQQPIQKRANGRKSTPKRPKEEWLASSTETRRLAVFSWCSRRRDGNGESEDTSDTATTSETEAEEEGGKGAGAIKSSGVQQGAVLVMVDGEMELELETLLKASAYILGATGSSIVYKAVLADGTALAVRRIGESSSIDKLRDFEAQVRSIARLRHPNLLRVLGFYWGADEKLLIYEYAPNGSLGNINFSKKLGSSPKHLTWEARLRIARGVARCLAYLHDKKCVHGNIKPCNILLGADFEPLLGDFGLERLLSGGDPSIKPGTSSRQFGSKRSTLSQSSLPDLSPVAGASLSPSPSASFSALSAPLPYHAPESLKNLKPNYKWDVYSFGVVLLELIAGRVFSEAELCQWNAGFVVEERNRVLRMADPTLRGEVEGKEEALLTCFKLGFSCAALLPQRRPSMRDAVQVLDKIPSSSTSVSALSS